MPDYEKMLEYIADAEEAESEEGNIEACEALALIKAEIHIREKRKPEEKQDNFGDIWAACPNCGESLRNYFNKNILPPYCMMCGQAIDWRS